jgi:hypothetical protein
MICLTENLDIQILHILRQNIENTLSGIVFSGTNSRARFENLLPLLG